MKITPNILILVHNQDYPAQINLEITLKTHSKLYKKRYVHGLETVYDVKFMIFCQSCDVRILSLCFSRRFSKQRLNYDPFEYNVQNRRLLIFELEPFLLFRFLKFTPDRQFNELQNVVFTFRDIDQLF